MGLLLSGGVIVYIISKRYKWGWEVFIEGCMYNSFVFRKRQRGGQVYIQGGVYNSLV